MDVQLILDKLSEMGYLKLGKITGNYHSVHCPFHSNGQEKKPSCGVLLRDEYRNGKLYPQGLFHCFACQQAKTMEEAVTFILRNHKVDKDGLAWLVENIPGFEAPGQDSEGSLIPDSLVEAMSAKFALQSLQDRLGQKKQEFVSEEELASYRYTVPYMRQRGLTDEIIEAYDIGFDPNFIPPGRTKKVPCITFPVRDREGRTLFLCRRSIEGKLFNYPEGVVKPLYGIDMIPKGCKSLLLVESCINTLTAVKWGFASVGFLGTGNDYQIQQLKELGVPELVLCFDGDDAGKHAERRIKRAMQQNALIYTVHMPAGVDVNDCTYEEFLELYNARD